MELKEKKIEISVNQEDVQNIIDCYEKDIEYIKRLENNWNELKKDLKKELADGRSEANTWLMGCYDEADYILARMQEIEGGVDNE